MNAVLRTRYSVHQRRRHLKACSTYLLSQLLPLAFSGCGGEGQPDPSAVPGCPRVAVPGQHKHGARLGNFIRRPQAGSCPWKHSTLLATKRQGRFTLATRVWHFAPHPLTKPMTEHTLESRDVFHWTTISLATAMIFIYFYILICGGLARQDMRDFYKCTGRAEWGSTENSVNYKCKCLLRAFEKHFNKIHIKIILTAILSIWTWSHVQ